MSLDALLPCEFWIRTSSPSSCSIFEKSACPTPTLEAVSRQWTRQTDMRQVQAVGWITTTRARQKLRKHTRKRCKRLCKVTICTKRPKGAIYASGQGHQSGCRGRSKFVSHGGHWIQTSERHDPKTNYCKTSSKRERKEARTIQELRGLLHPAFFACLRKAQQQERCTDLPSQSSAVFIRLLISFEVSFILHLLLTTPTTSPRPAAQKAVLASASRQGCMSRVAARLTEATCLRQQRSNTLLLASSDKGKKYEDSHDDAEGQVCRGHQGIHSVAHVVYHSVRHDHEDVILLILGFQSPLRRCHRRRLLLLMY